jgi:predicted PurR-regulated permease PerM
MAQRASDEVIIFLLLMYALTLLATTRDSLQAFFAAFFFAFFFAMSFHPCFKILFPYKAND